jgi:hypothetical protein
MSSAPYWNPSAKKSTALLAETGANPPFLFRVPMRFLLALCLTVFTMMTAMVSPTFALPSTKVAAQQLYKRLPDFPKENAYSSKETGQVSEDNTLARRIITYHNVIKGRSPYSRIDWKFTLADYLGINDEMGYQEYPGAETLTANPMVRDRKVIDQLTRKQREALTAALVNIYDRERPEPR